MSPEKRESHRHTSNLRQLLISAVTHPLVAVDAGIEQITLDSLAGVARGLVAESLSDGLERGICILVDRHSRLIRTNTTFVGEVRPEGQMVSTSHSYTTLSPDLLLPRHQRFEPLPATNLHTHGPYNLPPSPPDLANLFYDTTTYNLSPCVYVASIRQHLLVFRTPQTPLFSPTEVDAMVDRWTQMLSQRLNQVLSPSQTLSQQLILNARAQSALLRDIAAKYYLLLFSGDLKGDIVTRTTQFHFA